jgi:hypothetical protein
MAFQVNYNNGAKAEVVQADDYAHEGENGEVITFRRIQT